MSFRDLTFDDKQKKRKVLKDKKDRLFELQRLKFDESEDAYKMRENLRAEIIRLEKETK